MIVIDETWITRQSSVAHALTQPLEQTIAGHRNNHQAIGRTVRIERRRHRVTIAHQARRDTVGEKIGQAGHLQTEQHIEHGNVDVLRARRMPFAGEQRRADRPGGIDASTQIANRLTAAGRACFGKPGHAHQTRQGLGNDVVGRSPRERTVLTETGNTRVDQSRVVLLQGVEIDTESLGHPRTEVLHYHIRVSHQLIKSCAVGLGLEVDFDAPLTAIDQAEIHAFTLAKRPQVSTVITVHRHFELDYIGAQVCQQSGAVRAGEHPTEIQNAHALKLLGEGSDRAISHVEFLHRASQAGGAGESHLRLMPACTYKLMQVKGQSFFRLSQSIQNFITILFFSDS